MSTAKSVKPAAAKKPIAKQPIAKKPVAKQPAAKRAPTPSVAASSVAGVAPPVKLTQPAKPAKPAKAVKSPKPPKVASAARVPKPMKLRQKPVRDSFTMPEGDFALIATLKARLLAAKRETKKSELLRAGLHALAALDSATLLAALNDLAPVKVGRPKSDH